MFNATSNEWTRWLHNSFNEVSRIAEHVTPYGFRGALIWVIDGGNFIAKATFEWPLTGNKVRSCLINVSPTEDLCMTSWDALHEWYHMMKDNWSKMRIEFMFKSCEWYPGKILSHLYVCILSVSNIRLRLKHFAICLHKCCKHYGIAWCCKWD